MTKVTRKYRVERRDLSTVVNVPLSRVEFDTWMREASTGQEFTFFMHKLIPDFYADSMVRQSANSRHNKERYAMSLEDGSVALELQIQFDDRDERPIEEYLRAHADGEVGYVITAAFNLADIHVIGDIVEKNIPVATFPESLECASLDYAITALMYGVDITKVKQKHEGKKLPIEIKDGVVRLYLHNLYAADAQEAAHYFHQLMRCVKGEVEGLIEVAIQTSLSNHLYQLSTRLTKLFPRMQILGSLRDTASNCSSRANERMSLILQAQVEETNRYLPLQGYTFS